MKILYSHVFLVCALLFSPILSADEEKPCMVVASRETDAKGFFAAMNFVARCIYLFESSPEFDGQFNGLKVDFGNYGIYYDPDFGPNWWSYYFEPIELGNTEGPFVEINILRHNEYPFVYEYYEQINQGDRTFYHHFAQNHARIKQNVIDRVELTRSRFPSDIPIIGIHYRGTDKNIREAKRVPYIKMLDVIKKFIQEKDFHNFKLFVATDEEEFLSLMQLLFHKQLIYQQDILRSNDGEPVHKRKEAQYERGLEALTDCLLLSECDYLIRTASHLSKWSTFFNPDLPCILVEEE